MQLFTLWHPPDLLSMILGKQFIYESIFCETSSHYCISKMFLWLEILINVYSKVCSFTSSLGCKLLFMDPRIIFTFSHTRILLTFLQLVTHYIPHLRLGIATAWGVSPYCVLVQWILPALHAFILNFTLHVSDIKIIWEFDLVLKEAQQCLHTTWKAIKDLLLNTEQKKVTPPQIGKELRIWTWNTVMVSYYVCTDCTWSHLDCVLSYFWYSILENGVQNCAS